VVAGVDNETLILISVHFPKSGGTALRRVLADVMGESRLLLDYTDDPLDPATPIWIHPDWYMAHRPKSIAPFAAVHGHFPIAKYDLVGDAARVVLLREPVENLISIFYFWKHLTKQPYEGHGAFNFFKRNDLSLLETASIPALRRLMSRTYFGGYDMSRFDIIGDFSKRAEYLAGVSRRLGVRLDPNIADNTTPYSREREEMLADPRMIVRLRDLLLDDVRFYERHVGRGL
jgi:hypothetical protein